MLASRVDAEEKEMMVGKRLEKGELWQPGGSILAYSIFSVASVGSFLVSSRLHIL